MKRGGYICLLYVSRWRKSHFVSIWYYHWNSNEILFWWTLGLHSSVIWFAFKQNAPVWHSNKNIFWYQILPLQKCSCHCHFWSFVNLLNSLFYHGIFKFFGSTVPWIIIWFPSDLIDLNSSEVDQSYQFIVLKYVDKRIQNFTRFLLNTKETHLSCNSTTILATNGSVCTMQLGMMSSIEVDLKSYTFTIIVQFALAFLHIYG